MQKLLTLLTLLLMLALAVGTIACGGREEKPTATPTPTQTPIPTVSDSRFDLPEYSEHDLLGDLLGIL